MKDILNNLKKIDKKIYLILGSLLLVSLIILAGYTGITNIIKQNGKQEQIKEIEYETHSVNGNIGKVIVILTNEKGLNKVSYVLEDEASPIEIYASGRTQVAFDYKMEDRKQYKIKAELKDGEEKIYTIDYEIPRIKGTYKLVNGIYVNEPDSTRIKKRVY
mgnify:CR=1 FL=1